MMNEADIEAAKAQVMAKAPKGVRLVVTDHAHVAPELLLVPRAAAEDDLANRPTHHDRQASMIMMISTASSLPLPVFANAEEAAALIAQVSTEFGVLRARVLRISPANPCGSPCRGWARGCSTISTAPGPRAKRVSGVLSS